VELAPKCRRIIKWLEHFFRRLHRVLVLRFVWCGIFVAPAHHSRQSRGITFVTETDFIAKAMETLLKPMPCVVVKCAEGQRRNCADKVKKQAFAGHGKATKSNNCKSQEHKAQREKKERDSKTDDSKSAPHTKLRVWAERLLLFAIASNSKATKVV
jgi:hypothetical protein